MEGTNGKRRLAQSTLFPHRDRPVKEGEHCDGNREEEVEEEELCASSQKRTESKRKTNVKRKSAPVSSKKVTENAQETSEKQVGESDSPVIPKSSFFVKASERRQQKRQQNQPILIDSPEENDNICSPPNPVSNGGSTPQKMKRRNNSTPKKDRTSTPKKEKTSTPKKKSTSTPNKKMKSGARELQFGEIPFDLTLDDQPLQTIPDLRSEAKRMAEENSRMYSGKQIHPFFTSIKGGKTSQDSTCQEHRFFSCDRKDKGMTFNPIHVLENSELDHTILDWGDWVVFSEGRPMNGPERGGYSPVNEKSSIDTLSFDNLFNISHLTRLSLHQKYDQCSTPKKEVPSKSDCSNCTSSLSLADTTVIWSEQKELNVLPNNMLASSVELMSLDHKPENPDFFVGSPCDRDLVSELQEKLLQERITSHYHSSHSTPENCIWTDKYQPQNAKQICGNSESVKLLSEWLHLWHQRSSLTSRNNDDKLLTRDIDAHYQLSDSDSDTIDGEDGLKNVLLVTGLVGCGKSAAIYACARERISGYRDKCIGLAKWSSYKAKVLRGF